MTTVAGLLLLALSVHAQSISFVDRTESAGLLTVGHGVAVYDFDRDGRDDVFVAGSPSKLFRNLGDARFEDVTERSGLHDLGTHRAALWGDVDGDGLADLFLGGFGTNRLFAGRGEGTFEDVTTTSGIDRALHVSTSAFGDVDGDGAIDLFAAVDRAPDVFYRNSGGVFEDVSFLAGVGGPSGSVPMQVTWIDFDRDNDLDLFCVHDGRVRSRLYLNSGSLPLSDVTMGSRIDLYPDAGVCCNMGTAWGDFDGDGLEDAYVTRIGTGGLFRNNGDGTFTDVATERGAARNGMSWGVVFADFDNDTDPDLFIVSTSGYDGTPTLLYRNDGGTFREIGRDAGVSLAVDAKGLASGDFNNDGLIDLVVASENGKNRLLMNATEAAGHWLELRLRRLSGSPIGARVEVEAGGKTLVRTVSGGNSFASQSSSTLHFGLGDAARVERMRIYWGGEAIQEERDLPVDTILEIVEAATTTLAERDERPGSGFRLEGNHPNPFSLRTTVDYTVSEPGPVRLEVFDTLGRRVAVLDEGIVSPGRHSLAFDAGELRSGVYLYRLITRGGTAGGRLIVAR